MTDTTEQKDRIRDLNDRMRAGDKTINGKMIFTSGLLRHLDENDKTPDDIVRLVIAYDDFNPDNDPHKEHDFGSFKFCDEKIYWKIDYYDLAINYGSNDPSNNAKTFRMLTVFLASEY